jgi:ATP-binding cassette subfamily C (CFTR/MRP) protein 4
LLLFFAAVQVTEVMTTWWLQQWVDTDFLAMKNGTDDRNGTSNIPRSSGNGSGSGTVDDDDAVLAYTGRDETYYIRVYGILVGCLVTVAFGRAVWYMRLSVAASRGLHAHAFEGTVSTTMRFFDSNPVGRVLNRFAKDTGFVDDLLPSTAMEVVGGVLQILGSVIITCSLNPWVVLIVLPLGVSFYFVRRYFLKSSREVKRVESVVRSPIYSLFSTSLEGLSTIRANDSGERFVELMESGLDDHSRAYLAFIAVHGARFSAEIYTRGCHWIPRMFA